MHIISIKMLRDFWQKHPEAGGVLREWRTAVQHAEFADFNHIIKMLNSADYVPPYTIFVGDLVWKYFHGRSLGLCPILQELESAVRFRDRRGDGQRSRGDLRTAARPHSRCENRSFCGDGGVCRFFHPALSWEDRRIRIRANLSATRCVRPVGFSRIRRLVFASPRRDLKSV